jgi:hypothetical protein
MAAVVFFFGRRKWRGPWAFWKDPFFPILLDEFGQGFKERRMTWAMRMKERRR